VRSKRSEFRRYCTRVFGDSKELHSNDFGASNGAIPFGGKLSAPVEL
jgi:hypothetical protein